MKIHLNLDKLNTIQDYITQLNVLCNHIKYLEAKYQLLLEDFNELKKSKKPKLKVITKELKYNTGGYNHICKNCSKEWNDSNKKATYCSKDCMNQYVNLHKKTKRNKYKYRKVAEQKLGRPLQPLEIVHHIDGDSSNNNPDNLLVCDHATHYMLHKEMRKKVVNQ